jgi:hypothetical protein
MRNRIVRVGVPVVAGLLLVLGVACDQESTAEKQEDLCTEISQLNSAVTSLEDLGPTATVGQLKDAQDEVEEQAEDVRRAFRSLEESKEGDLDQAVDNLQSSVRDISNDDTIAQAKAAIAQDLAAVRVAWEQLGTRYGCP